MSKIIWKYDSKEKNSFVFPLCEQGVDRDWEVELVPSEDLENAFLYVSADYVGYVYARLKDEELYTRIDAYTTTPKCFLGDLTADNSVFIDFRLHPPYGQTSLGLHFIEIKLGYGKRIVPYYTICDEEMWLEPDVAQNYFWNKEKTSYYWVSSCS